MKEGIQPRLGMVGRDKQPDVVLGIVLLAKEEKSLPALEGLKKKIHALNHGSLLPPGMHISTLYDRTELIETTTHTVQHVILTGLVLVTLVLLLMLGDLRITFIAAVTIPFAVLFAFALMVLTGRSANLISIGAIDFGILVDASIVVLESIYRKLTRRVLGENTTDLIVEGVADASRPVLFSTFIILVAFIPLFTMQGVPGKIFAPMSVTYGFALTGALIYALVFAPVLGSFAAHKQYQQEQVQTRLNGFLSKHYDVGIRKALAHSSFAWTIAGACFACGYSSVHIRRRRIHAAAGGGQSLDPRNAATGYFVRRLGSYRGSGCARRLPGLRKWSRPFRRWGGPTMEPMSAHLTISRCPYRSSRGTSGDRASASRDSSMR